MVVRNHFIFIVRAQNVTQVCKGIEKMNYEEYYHDKNGKLILQHRTNRRVLERPNASSDSCSVFEGDKCVWQGNFSDLDLSEWLWVLPKVDEYLVLKIRQQPSQLPKHIVQNAEEIIHVRNDQFEVIKSRSNKSCSPQQLIFGDN